MLVDRIEVGPDCYLKVLEIQDSNALYFLTEKNRTRLREWLPWLDQTRTESDSLRFIEMTLKQMESNESFQTGVWFNNYLVGVIGHHEIDWPNMRTSLGYWLDID